jgi:pimeloyl-ACP methyl ester carboxylesterase
MTDEQLRSALFHAPHGPVANAYFMRDPDPVARSAAEVRATWANACSGKFLWPIPDRGLRNRLHRIRAPTLVVWGESDRLISPVYAADFAESIPDSRVELVSEAGHVVQWEQPEALEGVIKAFLAAEDAAMPARSTDVHPHGVVSPAELARDATTDQRRGGLLA